MARRLLPFQNSDQGLLVRQRFILENREMLVLSRKEGERLVIGENVIITINRIAGNRITLGIEAPRDVRIVRGELDRRESVAPEMEKGNCASSAMSFELDLTNVVERVAG